MRVMCYAVRIVKKGKALLLATTYYLYKTHRPTTLHYQMHNPSDA